MIFHATSATGYASDGDRYRLRYVDGAWSAYRVMPRRGVCFLGSFEDMAEAAMECQADADSNPTTPSTEPPSRARACVEQPVACAEFDPQHTSPQLETPQ